MIFNAIIICLLNTVSATVVQTTTGPVRGVDTFSEDVEAFLGIPYAEPPIGKLRFAKPVTKKPWDETFDASTLPPPCPQLSYDVPYYFMPDITNMTENCLYLNIWASKSSALKPVIIFLHPGTFYSGASGTALYDGAKLARHGDVIVVTINYRVGAFGYFLAYIEEAGGNMGMYDQLMAMKWLKANAIHFGGNPDNIVLMGESAGAISVSAHLVSPMSVNLFNKAILQSGTIIQPFFLDNNTRVFKNSKQLASITGCSNETVTLLTDPQSVVACLKHIPMESIVKAEKQLLSTNPFIMYPRINDEFLPQSGVDLLRAGKFNRDIPILLGFNKDEGSLLLLVTHPEYFSTHGYNISMISKGRAIVLAQSLLSFVDEPNSSKLARYFVGQVKTKTSDGYLQMLSDVAGDYVLTCNTLFLAEFLALGGNPVYFYKFGFRPASSPMAEWTGTMHLDELQYIFGNPYYEAFTKEEAELSDRMMDRWSAFAKTGNPNIRKHMPWPPYSYETPFYLSIEQEEESIRMRPNKDRCEIWRKRFQAEINTTKLFENSNSHLRQIKMH